MTKRRLSIFGAGGHGKVVSDSARLMDEWQDITVFDDQLETSRQFQAMIQQSIDETDIVIAIGQNEIRHKLLLEAQSAGFNLPIIAHPSSVMSEDSSIGAGSVLMAGAIINPGTLIGKGCIINTAASVDHDCEIGDCVHVAPGARLAGGVTIREQTWIGIGAVVCENRKIGKKVMVAAGAVIISDIADEATVKGVPAS